MIDVGLSVFRLKDAMSKYIHINTDISLCSVREIVLSFSRGTIQRLISCSEHRGEEGGRRTGHLSLASVATGHSLEAPCGLGISKEAGGVSLGGGEETPSQSHTGCDRAGRRKWPGCGRAFTIGMCEGAVSEAAHVPM